MPEKHEPFAAEIDSLRALRDELRVQLNLAGKEARDAFEAAEKTWSKLEGRLKLVERESRSELQGVGKAARALADEIRGAYRRVRELI
ncbi:MAG: hypothetical protein ACHQ6T_07945 [Myxococcota bacterium]